MQTGGIFLNERSERVASLGQFALLAQFRRGLKFRQADGRRRLGRNVAALLVTHGDVLVEGKTITKEGIAAEHDQSQQQSEEPLHGYDNATINLRSLSLRIVRRHRR